MNPKELFDKIVENIIQSEGEKIKKYLIDSHEEEYSFIKVTNTLSEKYYQKHQSALTTSEEYKNYYELFINSLGDYKGNLDNKIKNSLEKAVKNYHNKTNNKLESYEFAIKGIAEIYGLKETKAILNRLEQFIEDMYELGDFTHYKFEDFNYPYSDEWESVHKKRFPDSSKKQSANKDFAQEIENTNRYLSNFDEQEKLLLLRLFYRITRDYHKKGDEMQYSDFSKIILIISNLEKPDIFYKDSQSSTVYKKVNKHDYTSNDIKLFKRLILKLKIHDMTFTIGIINKIIDEHNKKKQKQKNN